MMPKRAQYTVSWLPERTAYLLREAGSVEDFSLSEDNVSWLRWLEEHHAFAFDGRGGHLKSVEGKPSTR